MDRFYLLNPWNAIRSPRLRVLAAAMFLAAAWFIGAPIYDQDQLESELKLAEMGNADSMVLLGLRYKNGEVVTKDYAQAMAWYLKAAKQGSGWALAEISDLYANGLGVPQDGIKAYAWALQSERHYYSLAENRRSRLAQSMRPEQIQQAESLAEQWRPDNP